MAILLQEEGLYERAHLYGTDMSGAALERAREGIYSQQQAATFADNYRAAGGRKRFEDYCAPAYGNVAILDGLKRNVVFFRHNLVADFALGQMHVVFCRNVLMYFGTELYKRVLDMLTPAIYPGGFLCLGASERLSQSLRGLFFEPVKGQAIYQYRPSP